MAFPDAEALLERLRPDFDLHALATRLRRSTVEGNGAQALNAVLEHLQADSAWPKLSRFLDRVYGEPDWKRLRQVAQRLHPDIEFPEVPLSLNPQHRQALRGLLLLGVLLHTSPVPLRAPSPFSGTSRPTVTELRNSSPPASQEEIHQGHTVMAYRLTPDAAHLTHGLATRAVERPFAPMADLLCCLRSGDATLTRAAFWRPSSPRAPPAAPFLG